MLLTQADVHNVAFAKPPIGKRGYNEDEVDQFLDLVEDSLAQLNDEIDRLKDELAAAESKSPAPASVAPASSAPVVSEDELRKKVAAEYEAKLAEANKKLQAARSEADNARKEASDAKQALEKAKTSQSQVAAAKPAADDATVTRESTLKAARVLELAQEMADRLTSDAKDESKSLVDNARSAAEKTVS